MMQGCAMWWTHSIGYKKYKKVIPILLPNMYINIYTWSFQWICRWHLFKHCDWFKAYLKQINKCLNQYTLYLPRNCI